MVEPGLFRGFNINYPTYSVITPQTGEQFDVRCLTVSDVNEIKKSVITPSRAYGIINEVIWKCLKKKPDYINSFEDFLKYVTINDRISLIYGIYHSTFGNVRDFSLICRSCGNQQRGKFELDKMFSMNPYPYSKAFKKSYKIAKAAEGQLDPFMESILRKEFIEGKECESILTKRVQKELPISKVIAYIRQPTLFDEHDTLNSIPFISNEHVEVIEETLAIDKFEYTQDGTVIQITNREDILTGYESLPLDDKATIFDTYNQEFDQYNIQLKSNWICNSCKQENKLNLNIVSQFFRVVQSF